VLRDARAVGVGQYQNHDLALFRRAAVFVGPTRGKMGHLAARSMLLCALVFRFYITHRRIDGSHTGYDLATRSELDGVAAAVRQIPVTAVFAGFPTYNHPLLLNGRDMVAGYTGHLWSHGIDYEDQVAMLESMLNGDPTGGRPPVILTYATSSGSGGGESLSQIHAAMEQSCPKIAEGAWGQFMS